MGTTRNPASVRLREWRTKKGLKLAEAAQLFGCSEPWASMIERGLKPPGSVRLALAIERATGIKAEDWPAPERKPRKRKAA